MVEAQDIQNGCVQIPDFNGILYDLVSHLVGLTESYAGFDSASGHPNGESAGIVIAANQCHGLPAAIFPHRGAAKFAAPNHQRILHHAASFQIGQQRSHGLIHFAATIRETDVQGLFRV